MTNSKFPEFNTSQSQDTVPGFWKLAPGRALSMQPRQNGMLRVAQGRVWVTLDAEHQGAGNELGDYFLHAGEQLAVKPGQHLVMELVEGAGPQAAFFEWTPAAPAFQADAVVLANVVTPPLRDLACAIAMAGAALGHLCTGLLAYVRQSVRGRAVAVQSAAHCS